ncbi:hypothetical protein B296_00024404 [Ensete ventricosum]|uniref:Uncharacterized protein n=1 Tax=Ensete ventricosum TaxID=4639 RepID=A0A427AJU7_ENSVE|nr:hypothetical protein B296_00024404 [Ensete ventricosum]
MKVNDVGVVGAGDDEETTAIAGKRRVREGCRIIRGGELIPHPSARWRFTFPKKGGTAHHDTSCSVLDKLPYGTCVTRVPTIYKRALSLAQGLSVPTIYKRALSIAQEISILTIYKRALSFAHELSVSTIYKRAISLAQGLLVLTIYKRAFSLV